MLINMPKLVIYSAIENMTDADVRTQVPTCSLLLMVGNTEHSKLAKHFYAKGTGFQSGKK